MAMEYTEEQLNNFDKTTLVQLFLVQQSQLRDIDQKLQLLLEQAAVLNNNRFGKSSEKLGTENQISFLEVDGNIIYFNEAEAIDSLAEYEVFFASTFWIKLQNIFGHYCKSKLDKVAKPRLAAILPAE